MPANMLCPVAADLQRYLLGQIPNAEASAIDAHLEQCAICVQSLNGVAGRDPLVDAMQASGSMRRPRNPFIENLVVKLESLSRTFAQSGPAHYGVRPEATSLSAAHETIASAPTASALATAGPDSVQLTARPPDNPRDYLAPAQAPDEMGRLGGYRILKVLGQGGMGVVFLAEDIGLKRRIALKVMRPSIAASPEARQRFTQEAQATAQIEHEYIIAIFQVSEDRGVPFLAMPLLQGETLEERLRRETKLPIADAVRLAREIAEGLAAAHDKALIHRDIKPVNIWLARPLTLPGNSTNDTDSPARVKILDFGLARSLEGDMNLTQTGAIVGTPAYMSPEQARGEKLDGRSDLFSLGCVLYRMLTGERPFKGATPMSQLRSLELDDPLPPQSVNPQVPAPLSQLTMRLLRKNVAERPASAKAVVNWLRAIEGDLPKQTPAPAYPIAVPVQSEAPTFVGQMPTMRGPNRRPAALVAAALLLLLVGGVAATGLIWKWSGQKPDPNAPHQPEIRPDNDDGISPSLRAGRKLKIVWTGKMVAEAPEDKQPLPQLSPGAYVAEPLPIKDLEKWTIKCSSFLGNPPDEVIFLPDGTHVAIMMGSYYYHLNMFTFELKEPYAGPTYTALSPDEKEWVTVSGNEIIVESLVADKEKRTFREFVKTVQGVAYSPDGTKLAAQDLDSLQIFDMVTRSPFKKVDVRGTHVGWSPDGTRLYSFNHTASYFQIIEANTGAIKKTLNTPGGVLQLQWSPQGGLIASYLSTGKLLVWEMGDSASDSPVDTGVVCTTRMSWSSDGQLLGYGNGNDVCLWSLKEQKELPQLKGHTKAVKWVGFSPDGQTTISCSHDQTIRFWETATGRYLGAILLVNANGQACCLAVSTKGYYSGGKDVERVISYEYIRKKQAFDKRPEDFFGAFDWTNDRSRVKLLAGEQKGKSP